MLRRLDPTFEPFNGKDEERSDLPIRGFTVDGRTFVAAPIDPVNYVLTRDGRHPYTEGWQLVETKATNVVNFDHE